MMFEAIKESIVIAGRADFMQKALHIVMEGYGTKGLKPFVDFVDYMLSTPVSDVNVAELQGRVLGLCQPEWLLLVEKHIRWEGDEVLAMYMTMADAVADFPKLYTTHSGEEFYSGGWEEEIPSAVRDGFTSRRHNGSDGNIYTFSWYKVRA